MLRLLSLTKKEVPEELQRTEMVIQSYKEDENEIKNENNFLIAEKNSVPIYVRITAQNLIHANNREIQFFDIEEKFLSKPDVINNCEYIQNIKLETALSHYSISGVLNFIKGLAKFKKSKELVEEDGFNQIKKLKKENKFIIINSMGEIICIIANNLLLLISLGKDGKIIYL